jgi:hypothetical protein
MHVMIEAVPFTASILGFCMGFGFGVGCALAVLYSLFLHGYRAALRDAALETAPERLLAQRAVVSKEIHAGSKTHAQ